MSSYPDPIPSNTSIPSWAYLNVTVRVNEDSVRFQRVTDKRIQATDDAFNPAAVHSLAGASHEN